MSAHTRVEVVIQSSTWTLLAGVQILQASGRPQRVELVRHTGRESLVLPSTCSWAVMPRE